MIHSQILGCGTGSIIIIEKENTMPPEKQENVMIIDRRQTLRSQISKRSKNLIQIKQPVFSPSEKWSGADPGFQERGVRITVWGFTLLIISDFSKISHAIEIIWSH